MMVEVPEMWGGGELSGQVQAVSVFIKRNLGCFVL
jgi:hypothetical protein